MRIESLTSVVFSMLVGTKLEFHKSARCDPLTRALSPSTDKLGERVKSAGTLTQGCTLGYRLTPGWGSTRKNRSHAAAQTSNLQTLSSRERAQREAKCYSIL